MIGGSCDILVTSGDHQRIMAHLFPGDQDEHGAILRAGIVRSGSSLRLLIQHFYPAEFGTDYVAGKIRLPSTDTYFNSSRDPAMPGRGLGVPGYSQSRKRPACGVQ